MSLVFVVCCASDGFSDQLISHAEESYWVFVPNCVRFGNINNETPWPVLGCWVAARKIPNDYGYAVVKWYKMSSTKNGTIFTANTEISTEQFCTICQRGQQAREDWRPITRLAEVKRSSLSFRVVDVFLHLLHFMFLFYFGTADKHILREGGCSGNVIYKWLVFFYCFVSAT
jgi:hypothetical protein